MSNDELDLVERLHALAGHLEMPHAALAEDLGRGRRRARRNQNLVLVASAAALAAVLGVVAIVGGHDGSRSDEPDPVETPSVVETPGVVVGEVPVWYDADGLHRGDVVEPTPVELGSLALVRRGAVYNDRGSGDVWFHPWGGEPRIVGRASEAGPGGDPQGDVAAWFEGSDALNASAGDLVVYDTGEGREISRTRQKHGVEAQGGDHYPDGNKFLQVSAERVVWSSFGHSYALDVLTGETERVDGGSSTYLIDVQDDVEVWGERAPYVALLRVPGRDDQPLDGLETHLKLSTTGNHILAVEEGGDRHAAAILDTRTGDLWPAPRNGYPWIAWSYGDLALVDVDPDGDDDSQDVLLACDADARVCDVLDAERPLLLPTN